MNEKISNEEINAIKTNEIQEETKQEISKKADEVTQNLENSEITQNSNSLEVTLNLETSGTMQTSEVEISSEDLVSAENVQSSEESSFEGVPNCLSLTVKEDYKLSIVKNVFFKSIRSGLKIAFSVLTLNLLKLFL